MKEKVFFVRIVIDRGYEISAENEEKAYDVICKMFDKKYNIYLDADEVVDIIEQEKERK